MTGELRTAIRLVIDRERRQQLADELAQLDRTIAHLPSRSFHGTETGYSLRCRCDDCREAARRGRRYRRRVSARVSA